MTPQELIDAVRPCLPLPGIIAVDYDPDIKLSFLMETEGDGWQSMPLKPYALNHIIGALDQACVENCWEVIRHAMLGHYTRINYGSMRSEFVSVNGTDAVAFCRAYAQAKEATHAS